VRLDLLSKKEIIRRYRELEKEKENLEKEKEDLEKELHKYKNSNTPPSANPHLKPAVSKNVVVKSHARGAPVGHTGTTKLREVPDETRHITCNECPMCHSKNINVKNQLHQQQEEMPREIKPLIIDVVRDVCRCDDCNLEFIARDGMTPVQGRFGVNLMVLVLFLKFIVRGVLRKTSSFLDASFALKLAPASVQAIIERAAKAGENEYEDLKVKIKNAKLLYVDETSIRVLGVNWWVWAFRTDTDLLLVIRNSRGSNVLEEILGKYFAGIVVCDCWRAYDFLSNASIQRCWAHLLRKSKELHSKAGLRLHKKLSTFFDQIIAFNRQERTEAQRELKYARLTKKLKKMITYYSRYDDCTTVIKYIDFHADSWFTCIKFANVQPTNNYAEQSIRETVIVRKIIGAFRSEKGTKIYETMASLIASWQYQKKDIKTEFYRMLSANLC